MQCAIVSLQGSCTITFFEIYWFGGSSFGLISLVCSPLGQNDLMQFCQGTYSYTIYKWWLWGSPAAFKWLLYDCGEYFSLAKLFIIFIRSLNTIILLVIICEPTDMGLYRLLWMAADYFIKVIFTILCNTLQTFFITTNWAFRQGLICWKIINRWIKCT